MYVREAHPTDSNWEDPTLDVLDPTTDLERRLVAKRCADSLGLKVPMVVDGVDDAVNMAYSAWPERLYVLTPDGVIHYKGELGPSGFKPAAAAAALAGLLGEAPPKLTTAEPAPDCEDDGFSGTWEGTGAGRILQGDFPVYAKLALGSDGTVGGRLEVTTARYPMALQGASYDAATGVLAGQVAMQGRRMEFRAQVTKQKCTAQITAPGGAELFAFTAERVQKGFPLVPGPEDPTGTWTGAATAKDPALQGKAVQLVLTGDAASPVGSLTIGRQTATIRRARYRPKTGDFACLAVTPDGGQWRVTAVITPAKAAGSATLGRVALVVHFECRRAKAATPPPDDGAEDF